MITTEEIAKLSDEQAQQLLSNTATRYFGTERWKQEGAEMLGISRQGVARWFRERPPIWAIILFEVLIDNKEIRDSLNKYAAAKNELDKLLGS